MRQESKEDTLHRLHRQDRETEESYELTTSITAANADHSYNGIMFDVEARGPFEVYVISVSVGGMLGRVVSSLEHDTPFNRCMILLLFLS